MPYRPNTLFIVSALVFLAFLLLITPVHSSQSTVISGYFSTLWGDGFSKDATQTMHLLTTDSGQTHELLIPAAIARQSGGLLHYNGKKVRIFAKEAAVSQGGGAEEPLSVVGIALEDQVEASLRQARAGGAEPWVTIMCKFADVVAEPKNLEYFQKMYSADYPGLNHYWKESSYNRINIDGSNAYGWYTLPQPRSYYVNGDVLNFSEITADCTKAADADVYFPANVGINLMFNDELDGYAWGGSRYITIDGQFKRYRVTWEPPWGYSDIAVIAHEMGHGFGMPHSSGAYGQTYDNVWDVMSNTWANCSRATHATYGCLGQHTIGYHRDLVGWLQEGEIFNYSDSTTIITLESLTLPQNSGYLLAKIPIGDSGHRYYTVEVRKREGYDTKLPTEAVIIHEIDESRSNGRNAYLVDIDQNGNTGDEGAVWSVGEVYNDEVNNVCIKVLSRTNTGYSLKIGCTEPPPVPSSRPSTAPIHILLLH